MARRKGKFWKIREDYRPLLIETKHLFPTLLEHVKTKKVLTVGYLCRRSGDIANIRPNRYPWALLTPEYDYVISFWASQFDGKEHSEKIFTTLHELLHIPRHGFIEGHPDYRRMSKHDIEDFAFLRNVYGINLHRMSDVMKGEKHLLKHEEGIKRFPRTPKVK
jgi:predicted metallopeptidase